MPQGMANRTSLEGFSPRVKAVERRSMLRPLSASEIVDSGLSIYRRTAKHVLMPALAPMAFCAASIIFFTAFVLPGLFRTNAGAGIGQQLGEAASAIVIGLFVGVPLFVIGLAYASGPVIRLTAQAMRGDALQPAEAHAIGLQSAAAVAATMFTAILKTLWIPLLSFCLLASSAVVEAMGMRESPLYLAAAALGIIGLVAAVFAVPAMMHRTILAPVVAILEQKRPLESTKRAQALVARNSYDQGTPGTATVMLFIAIAFLALVVWGGFSLVFSFFNVSAFITELGMLGVWRSLVLSLVDAFPLFLAVWLISPLWGTTATVLYFDRRVRLEAYDIETLAGDVLNADRQVALLN